MAVLWLTDPRTPYEAPDLLLILNLAFSTAVCIFIAYLAAASFLASGTLGILLLGSGVLLMGTAFLAAAVSGPNSPNVVATVHNVGMFAAALALLLSAFVSRRPRRPVRAATVALVVAYLGAVAFVFLTTYLALRNLTPPFFVQGRGGTSIRQVTLAAAVGMFAVSSIALATAPTRGDLFRRWYAPGLALLGVGLVGIMLQTSVGSPMGWLGRSAQYLGGVYLLVAAVGSVRQTRRWGLPLEAALLDAETRHGQTAERLDQAARSGGLGLWDLDLTTDAAWRTPQHDRLFGYDELQHAWGAEICLRHVVPEDRPIFQRAFEEALVTGRLHYQIRINPVNQPPRWIEANGEVFRDTEGKPVRMMGTVANITDRKAAEESLRESERWLRMSQEIARIGHYVFDIQADHWRSSEALNAIFGIDDASPRKSTDWLRIIHPEDRDSMAEYLAELLAHWNRFDREYRVVDQKSGEVRWVHGLGDVERGPLGEPTRLVGTIQDVTDRREVEAERSAIQGQFALASRLAAMGTLVAGVAHEINNPLAAELAGQGIALETAREARERLRTGLATEPKTAIQDLDIVIEALEDAQESGLRVARIVKDLALFASPDPKRTRVRLTDIVAAAMRWLPAYVTQVATIRVEDREAPDVMASAGQIEQVVVNLITNAARAMPPGHHGEIMLRIGAGSKEMARLEVIDQGVGIAAANLDRIFEPFFTTRRGGEAKGTGLGLAVCHAIVTAHGGALTVQSQLGKGSTFRMELLSAP
jgi:PAS domain S-box-containing protein